MTTKIKAIFNQIKTFLTKINKNYALIVVTSFFIISNFLTLFVNFTFGMKLNSFLCLIYDFFLIGFLLYNFKQKRKPMILFVN
ncbi:MAG: hypothetical protein Q8869_01245 [Candidatus Phytoplasma australasiaticum]|nr:hypothetical protein [Candidatus Phytoplasma australasiaticum]